MSDHYKWVSRSRQSFSVVISHVPIEGAICQEFGQLGSSKRFIKIVISWLPHNNGGALVLHKTGAYPGGAKLGGLAPPSTQIYTGRPKLKP